MRNAGATLLTSAAVPPARLLPASAPWHARVAAVRLASSRRHAAASPASTLLLRQLSLVCAATHAPRHAAALRSLCLLRR
jgi:hypothetical protein